MLGTSPVTAAKAMGMPKLKARPSTACGMATKRLAKGYATATAMAANDQAMVSGRKVRTKPNATNASTAPSSKASFTPIRPLVTGRSAVRLTCLSKSRSATSFKQHPALRMRMVPSVKTISKCQPGKPPDATHKADSVGHNNKSQPAGRFQRMRSKYKLIFSCME